MNRKRWEERQLRNRQIVKKMQNGGRLAEIAKVFGLSKVRIRTIFKEMTFSDLPASPKLSQNIQQLIVDYDSGIVEAKLAKKYQASEGYVVELLKNNRQFYLTPRKRRIYDRNEKILKRFKEGQNLDEISNSMRISAASIRSVLIKAGLIQKKVKEEKQK